MGKKLPVMPAQAREEEAARLASLTVRPVLELAELQSAIRDGLMAFSCAAGLLVIGEMMQAEVAQVAGPKGRHDADRVAERNGSAPGSVALGGRTVPVRRPRAVLVDGGEVNLDTYQAFSSRDLLTQVALERMLAGVATRRHNLVTEPIGTQLESSARSGSKSAVSRRFKAATEVKLAELMGRNLTELDVAAMMIDGIIFAECCVVVALAITSDGTKIPVGLWEGDTENKVVVTDLLSDLVARGLECANGVLFVLDGSKALDAGVKKVFGDRALIQRCTLHKRRNVSGYLRDDYAKRIDAQLAKAFGDVNPNRGLKVAKGIATLLDEQHPSAAASLREGLDDMFTVRRLGTSDLLARSLTCTNAVESMISVVQRLSGRVTKWKDPRMVRRWVGVGMIEAERSFRRIRGCKDMPAFTQKIRSEVARRRDPKVEERANAVA
jgi:transposase-like protein